MKGYLRARDRGASKGKKTPCTTWQLVIEGERDLATGKRVQHYRAVRGTKAEAERALRAFISERENGLVATGERLTVAAFLEQWLAHVATRVRPSTVARYRQLLERHVVRPIGTLKLRELNSRQVQGVYDAALAGGNDRVVGGALSNRTVVHLHRVLFAAMKQASDWDLVVKNPCAAVKPPRAIRQEMRALSGGEVRQLVAAAAGTRLYAPIVLTLAVGFRRGEVLGLGWDAIDFERGTASVVRSLQPDGAFSEPKTARSKRKVALPLHAIATLRAHKAAQNAERLAAGAAYVDGGFVFADALGGAWKPASISTLFHSICRRAGIGHVRFHDLRHTAASLLLEAGVPVPTVSATLGHANASITLSIYAHAMPGGDVLAASVMDRVLKGIESAS